MVEFVRKQISQGDSTALAASKVQAAVLTVIALVFATFGFVQTAVENGMVDASSWAFALIEGASAVLVVTAALTWCLFDSAINDYPFGKYLPVLFVVMLPLALPVYFYRSRGFRGGTLALARSLVFVALLVAAAVVTRLISMLILRI